MSILDDNISTGDVTLSKEVLVALLQSMGGCIVLDRSDVEAALSHKCDTVVNRQDEPFKLTFILEDWPTPL